MEVAIIGGGAAGFFSAIAVKKNHPNAHVVIFEKSGRVMEKLKMSGGGRCNVTNGCRSIPELCKAYPRGGKALKKPFHIFNTAHTWDWFESRGVSLVLQEDNCVFPASQDSQSIIFCFLKETSKSKVDIQINSGISSIERSGEQLAVYFEKESIKPRIFDKVIVTTGGSPRLKGLDWLGNLGHQIETPVPSLFTFKMPTEVITQLMGVVVEKALVSIQGTKFKGDGPLLITHWGMSGPAILKLSSHAARWLSENRYESNIQVNWANEANNDLVLEDLQSIIKAHPHKLITNNRPYNLSSRLWNYLLEKCEIPLTLNWVDLGKKNINKLLNILTNDIYLMRGRANFIEEFVTCGGVSLESVNMNTMESKVCKNLYFAGEVLDIDAITGGYNLQAAWTTGYIAGKLL
jgi:predicted Rossmann fold flavoprotein